MNQLLATTFAFIVLAPLAPAQDTPPTEAEKISQANVAAYVAAFNKSDAKALGALYAEDVQYTSDEGLAVAGRAAVQENLAKFLAKNKGATLTVQVDSARFLTPDVLLEKGFATVGDETTRYVCSYVKKGDAWLIAELNETTLPPVDAAAAALDDLAWLVGSWKDSSPGVTVISKVNWTNNHHFLCRSVTVERDGQDPMQATEVIGYDPVAGALRSWMFDSEGGFGEGTWKRDGNKWMNSFAGTAPDGSTSSAQHIITYIDEKKYTWESVNRQNGGEILPNIDKIEVVRTTAQ